MDSQLVVNLVANLVMSQRERKDTHSRLSKKTLDGDEVFSGHSDVDDDRGMCILLLMCLLFNSPRAADIVYITDRAPARRWCSLAV